MCISAHNDVVVYHDETKEAGSDKYRGHALLFIPVKLARFFHDPLFGKSDDTYAPQEDVYKHMMAIRHDHDLKDRKLHFTDISGKKWGRFDMGMRRIMDLGVDALRHKGSKSLKKPSCCKLAVMFYPKGTDLSLYGGAERKEKELRHDETVLRMLLKGACHYLYDATDMVVIKKLVTDGNPCHRPLDINRIAWKLAADEFSGRSPLRNYVEFAHDAAIFHVLSDHKTHDPSSPDYLHANLLQLTDLLLGAVIRTCLQGVAEWPVPPVMGAECKDKKDIIAYPVKEMLVKTARGRGFAHSGHYKSFVTSRVNFSSNGITFKRIEPKLVEGEPKNLDFGLSV